MNRHTGFRLTQGVYHLALGVWAGAMLMLAVGAMQTFAAVRAHGEALQGLTPEALAGAVVGRMIAGLTVVQMVCAVAVAGAVLLQHVSFGWALRGGRLGWANLTRLILIGLPMAVLMLNVLVISPAVWEHREAMYDAGQPTERREAARERFAVYHRLSERTHGVALLMLAGAIVVSPFAFELARREDRGP